MKNRTPSLKTLLRAMAPLLDLTEDQLYERQRELVRCGLLSEREGRGPGSGTPANYQTMSVLVASILATDVLKDLRSLQTNEAFTGLVQKVEDALRRALEVSFDRPNPSGMRSTTAKLSAPLSVAIQKLLEEKTALIIKKPEEKVIQKPIGRPRKFPRGRVCLTIRVTQNMHDILTERVESTGRSFSEEIEMILEKAFSPMDEATAERIREPNHASKQERIHQA